MDKKDLKSRVIKTEPIQWRKLEFIQDDDFKKWIDKGDRKLTESLINFHFVDPFKVWKDGDTLYCLDGKHRYLDLFEIEKSGIEVPDKLPATFLECKNKKDAAELVLIYSSRYADITEKGLFNFGEEFDVDIENEAFSLPDFENIEDPEAEAKEDDFEPEPPKEPKTKKGDLYEIGEHRLLCGDSTDSNDVDKLMDKNKADLMLADPPYEIEIKYSSFKVFCENCNIFIFNNDRAILKQLSKSPFRFKKFFVFYHPGTAIPQEGGNETYLDHILLSHEISGKPKTRYNKGLGTRTVIKGTYRKSKLHKHEKPFNLINSVLKGYSLQKDNVLDLFLGSGATMVAAQQLNRKCYGLELDPQYCDVIVARMLKQNDSITIKRNGKKLSKEELEKY